ncbi:MAG: hypothetical protein WD100_10210 [Tistlia sp.]|uniref:hypothetical protein n=1 Tax=Tistlia sp. TaxID=3057121 RepID=UPI0034A1B895
MSLPSYALEPDVERSFSLAGLRSFRLADGRTYAVVAHDPALRLIHDFWVGGFESEEEFRAVLAYVLEQMRRGGYVLWLADLRHLTSSFMASRHWLVEELMPQAIAAGLVREAVVLPPQLDAPEGFDVFGSASAALRDLADGRIRGFHDLGAAKRWLLEGRLPGH